MAERRRVHLFAEDLAHERFLTAVLERLAGEMGRRIHVTTANARGGHGRALAELKTHQRALLVGGGIPDLLVVAIDANCSGWNKVRNDVLQIVDPAAFPAHVLAIPDPHVERWYLADPPALAAAVEASVALTRRKCDRDEYKQILVNALRAAGHPVSLGGAEFATEIVAEMDFFRAGKNEPSFKHFVDELRGLVKTWG
jgi:hypothetical protein